ncbi:glutamate--tRNA ligase [Candidatus Gottesmanbacteria bacterium]|nr:glutamate--tRNA ligase [Candidatus Gottesmanbacteria bacterium]
MKQVRTRIAPSPTGEDLHIGNAYTALINYVFAKKHHGKFLVRIEDTDRTRLVEGSEQNILSSLHWLGFDPDESPEKGGPYSPYRQSERLKIYKEYAQELVENGHAYHCFCTPERLAQMRKDQEASHLPPMYDGTCRKLKTQSSKLKVEKGERYTIRLKVPKQGTSTFRDIIRGDISFENKLIDDQVLLKSDGYPTYHLGVVVDDHLMEISHIIRGEEWISSTPKHVLLYQFLGWTPPVFAHMPLLRNPDKSKLSKRKNPVWVSWYRREGFLPEAVRNYLATMAWSFPKGKELFSTEEMVKVFDVAHIQATAPVFDIEKLKWMNGEYIRMKTDEELISILDVYMLQNNLKSLNKQTAVTKISDYKMQMKKILPLVKERMKTLKEFESLAGFFFERPKELERPVNNILLGVAEQALKGSEWNHDAMEQAIRAAAEKTNAKAKDVFMELRVAVTGKSVGPPLLESLEILGREETIARLSSI